MPAQEEAKDLLLRARSLNDSNAFEEVNSLLEEATLSSSGSAPLYIEKAWALKQLSKTDEARKYIEQAQKADENLFEYYYNESVMNSDKGDYMEAVHLLDRALLLKPGDGISYYNRGWNWLRLNKFQEAVNDNTLAIRNNFDDEKAYNNRGLAYSNLGDFQNALNDFETVLKRNPGSEEAYFNRALTYGGMRKFDEAIADCTTLINKSPNYPLAYNNRAAFKISAGKFTEAWEDVEKAIALDPTSFLPYFNKGLLQAQEGNLDAAIKSYEYSISLNHQYPNSYYWLGEAYEKSGSLEKAIDSFEKAVALSPENNFLTSRINELKLRLGKKPEAAVGTDDAAVEFSDLIGNVPDQDHKNKIHEFASLFLTIINKIKGHALLTQPVPVAHYTKLWVADTLIAAQDAACLRYSNVTNMNDPEEGKFFRDILLGKDTNGILRKYFDEIRLFARADLSDNNIYLGSFLPASPTDEDRFTMDTNEDELVMWRTYGKDENNEEARGCSIVINSEFFYWPAKDTRLPAIQLHAGNLPPAGDEQGQNLYRVLYYNKSKDIFENENDIDNLQIKADIDRLKQVLNQAIALRDSTLETDCIDSIVYRGLSELRYFFKSSNYSFENEYRVIQYFSPDNEKVTYDPNDRNRPRVLYVESTKPITPHINRVYLGPRVPHPERWIYLEVALKRKSRNNSARVLPSSCKFQ